MLPDNRRFAFVGALFSVLGYFTAAHVLHAVLCSAPSEGKKIFVRMFMKIEKFMHFQVCFVYSGLPV